MSDINAPTPLPDTPWEFYPDDDLRPEPAVAAEDAAMHIDAGIPTLIERPTERVGEGEVEVVHYFEDEEPEVVDVSAPAPDNEHEPEVEDLLIRQHYLPSEAETEESP